MTLYELGKLSAMKEGAVTLCLGSSTAANIIDSFHVVREMTAKLSRGKVLYINTIQTRQQFTATFRKFCDEIPPLTTITPGGLAAAEADCLHSTEGSLASLRDAVEQFFLEGVKFVVINSIEFSSKDYRRKDELVFQILNWTDKYGVGVLLFAEAPKVCPRTGKIQRGCAGKLAAMADTIVVTVQKEEIYERIGRNEVQDAEFSVEYLEVEEIGIVSGPDAPDWLPANLRDEIILCETYKRNHPEFKPERTDTALDERKRIIGLIAKEKRREDEQVKDQKSKVKKEFPEMRSTSNEVTEQSPETALVREAEKLIWGGEIPVREMLSL